MKNLKLLKALIFVPLAVGCFSCSNSATSSSTSEGSTTGQTSGEPFITTVVPSHTSEVVSSSVTSEVTSEVPTSEVTSETSDVPTSESTSSDPTSAPTSESTSQVDPEDIYDEPEDSLDGVDPLDLSGLINAAKNVSDNYTTKHKHYFTDSALEYYYINYHKNLPSKVNNIVTDKYLYLYPEDSSYKVLDAYNTVLYQKNADVYGANIGEDSYETLMSKSTFDYASSLVEENKQISDLHFDLEDFNEEYLLTHEFTRISKNKYQCAEKSVIEDFFDIIVPNFCNDGYYMTFKRITIEVNEDGMVDRIRLYCNTTQSGKLVSSHKEEIAKPNWYMLFAECNVYNIGSTSIPCLDNLY